MVQDDPGRTLARGRRSFLETSTRPIFCKHFCLRRPPSHPSSPSPCTVLCHTGSQGKGPETQRCGKHPIPRDWGLEEAGAQVRGRRGPEPPGGRGPLCTDVSCLGGKGEGKFPQAICTLERARIRWRAFQARNPEGIQRNQWQDEGG